MSGAAATAACHAPRSCRCGKSERLRTAVTPQTASPAFAFDLPRSASLAPFTLWFCICCRPRPYPNRRPLAPPSPRIRLRVDPQAACAAPAARAVRCAPGPAELHRWPASPMPAAILEHSRCTHPLTHQVSSRVSACCRHSPRVCVCRQHGRDGPFRSPALSQNMAGQTTTAA